MKKKEHLLCVFVLAFTIIISTSCTTQPSKTNTPSPAKETPVVIRQTETLTIPTEIPKDDLSGKWQVNEIYFDETISKTFVVEVIQEDKDVTFLRDGKEIANCVIEDDTLACTGWLAYGLGIIFIDDDMTMHSEPPLVESVNKLDFFRMETQTLPTESPKHDLSGKWQVNEIYFDKTISKTFVVEVIQEDKDVTFLRDGKEIANCVIEDDALACTGWLAYGLGIIFIDDDMTMHSEPPLVEFVNKLDFFRMETQTIPTESPKVDLSGKWQVNEIYFDETISKTFVVEVIQEGRDFTFLKDGIAIATCAIEGDTLACTGWEAYGLGIIFIDDDMTMHSEPPLAESVNRLEFFRLDE